MSPRLRNDEDVLPRDLAERVDEACDRFEEALKAGQNPSLEQFLGTASEPGRPALFRELLGLELDYRKRCGERPARKEYMAHFPEYAEQLQAVFGEGAPAGSPSQSPVVAPGGRKQLPDNGREELPTVPGYEVLGVLGQGGMGVVYKARDLKLNRLVALKLIRAGSALDSKARARFRTEAEVIARLRHENVVRIYAVGEHKGQPYLVLEYIERGSLDRFLRGKPLPPRKAAALALKLALAVEHSHQYLIIHRDLKPANVLLTAKGEPKVTDFGLARDLDAARLTQSGTVIGTPCYMSPEQAAGDVSRIGPATDIYALGAILYEMLTGRPPFQGGNVLEVLAKVGSQQPPPPRAVNPAVPLPLEAVCLTCLSKAPSDRYASAAALAGDLRNFLKSEPIKAHAHLSENAPVAESNWDVWRNLRTLVLQPRGALSVCFLLLFAFSVFQGLRGDPRAALGLAAAVLAVPLVVSMAAQARLVPLAAGALGGLLVPLVVSLIVFSSLGGSRATLSFFTSEVWPLLYFSGLLFGLGAGVLFAGPWPRSGIRASLLALLMMGGLLSSDDGTVLAQFTLVAVWVAAIGRGAAAYWGSSVFVAVSGAFGGLSTAFFAFPITFALGYFGIMIDARFQVWFVGVLAVIGSIQGAVRSASIESKVRALMGEKLVPGGGRR